MKRAAIPVFLTVAGLGLLVSGGDLAAQTKTAPAKGMVFSADKKECLNTFHMETLLANSTYAYTLKHNASLLTDYSRCRAIVADEDEKIFGSFYASATPWRAFYRYKLWARIITEFRITPRLIHECSQETGKTPEACKMMMHGFFTNDDSFCKSDIACKAVVARDENLVQGKDKDLVLFVKALTQFDANLCEKITEEMPKRACRYYVTGDAAACESFRSFQQFKETCCGQIAEKEGFMKLIRAEANQ